uniref:Uncharacterized protein n=1 Tax=Anguilla anguilla TaxID=7936 RepID=A0A0E9W771_ANGAN
MFTLFLYCPPLLQSLCSHLLILDPAHPIILFGCEALSFCLFILISVYSDVLSSYTSKFRCIEILL